MVNSKKKMGHNMDKIELLETLEDERLEAVDLLEGLSDEVMLEPGVEGQWSIKDILAHLTAWEGQTVTLLFQAQQGNRKPTTVHFGDEQVDTLNQRWYELSKDRPLDMVWNDFLSVRKQTIRRVSEMSDKDLNDQNRYSWLKGVALIDLIINDTIEHEAEHFDVIREWLEQRDAKNNGSGRH